MRIIDHHIMGLASGTAARTGEVRGVGANGTAYVETTIRGEPHQFASPGVVELDGGVGVD